MEKYLIRISMSVLFFILSSCTNGDISLVKNSALERYGKTLTIGNTYDKYPYAKNVSWRAYKTEEGRNIVECAISLDQNKIAAAIKNDDIYVQELIKSGHIATLDNVKLILNFAIHIDHKTFETWGYEIEYDKKKYPQNFEPIFHLDDPFLYPYTDYNFAWIITKSNIYANTVKDIAKAKDKQQAEIAAQEEQRKKDARRPIVEQSILGRIENQSPVIYLTNAPSVEEKLIAKENPNKDFVRVNSSTRENANISIYITSADDPWKIENISAPIKIEKENNYINRAIIKFTTTATTSHCKKIEKTIEIIDEGFRPVITIDGKQLKDPVLYKFISKDPESHIERVKGRFNPCP